MQGPEIHQFGTYRNKLRFTKKVQVLSFEWKSDGVMDNKTGEADKDEMT